MDAGDIIKLVISILACFLAAGIGSLFTAKSVKQWYPKLKKPRFTPPNRVFGPVWTVLYILMAISVFFIWKEGLETEGVLIAFVLFWVQLIVNAIWSVVFFGKRAKGGGVVTIVILWLLILATIITSFRVSALAGGLLIPYIIWVSIASYLNTGVWLLNKPAAKIAG